MLCPLVSYPPVQFPLSLLPLSCWTPLCVILASHTTPLSRALHAHPCCWFSLIQFSLKLLPARPLCPRSTFRTGRDVFLVPDLVGRATTSQLEARRRGFPDGFCSLSGLFLQPVTEHCVCLLNISPKHSFLFLCCCRYCTCSLPGP